MSKLLKKILSYILPADDHDKQVMRQHVRDQVHEERNFAAKTVAEQRVHKRTIDDITRTARHVVASLERSRRRVERDHGPGP